MTETQASLQAVQFRHCGVLSIRSSDAAKRVVQLGFVIAMVTGIHFVEAYLLNPAIYLAHLKLHPLLVISTLVVAEHSLGVWGLLLAGEQACKSDMHIGTLSLAPIWMQLLRRQSRDLQLPNRLKCLSTAAMLMTACFLQCH